MQNGTGRFILIGLLTYLIGLAAGCAEQAPRSLKFQFSLIYPEQPQLAPEQVAKQVLSEQFADSITYHEKGSKVEPGIRVIFRTSTGASLKAPARETLWQGHYSTGRYGIGLSDVEAAAQPQAILDVFCAVIGAESDYQYLNTINRFIHAIASAGDAYIWDVEAAQLFSPPGWKWLRIDWPKDGPPGTIARANVTVKMTKGRVGPDGTVEGEMVHETRGMGKLGLPEAWVQVKPSDHTKVGALLFTLVETLAVEYPWTVPDRLEKGKIRAGSNSPPPELPLKKQRPDALPGSKAPFTVDYSKIQGGAAAVLSDPFGRGGSIPLVERFAMPALSASVLLSLDREALGRLASGEEAFYEQSAEGQKLYWLSERYEIVNREGEDIVISEQKSHSFGNGSTAVRLLEFSATPPYRLLRASRKISTAELGEVKRMTTTFEKEPEGETTYMFKAGIDWIELKKCDLTLLDTEAALAPWVETSPKVGDEISLRGFSWDMAAEGKDPPYSYSRLTVENVGQEEVDGRQQKVVTVSKTSPGGRVTIKVAPGGKVIEMTDGQTVLRPAPKEKATAKP